MKKLLFTTAFVAAIFMCGAQGNWTMLNPNPTLKHLADVSFVSQDKGWVVGEDGLIMHTNDGGENWEMQQSPTQYDLTSVFFVEENKGWAVASHYIFHTDDGGENWELQDHPTSQGAFLDVYFSSPDTGWVSGRVNMLFKTTDGGENWEKIVVNFGESKHFYRVKFIDAMNGCLVGSQYNYSDGFIAVTNDGGYTWTETTPEDCSKFNDVYFTDSLNGWACGNDYAIFLTEDGGYNWTEIPVAGSGFAEMHMNPDKSGILLNSYQAYFTYDGGLSWDSTIYTWTSSSLQRFRYYEDGFGVAVGNNGAMIKTCDGGQSWQRMNMGITQSIMDIGFFNELDGLAIAGSYYGNLYRTSDGGHTWSEDPVLIDRTYYMMRITGQSCFLLSGNYKLIISHNAGFDWDTLSVPETTYHYTDMFFTDENNGYLCSSTGELFKTIDGGETWMNKTISGNHNLQDMFFVTENLGWVVEATWEKVYRTEDGGDTWIQRPLIDYIVCQPQSLWFTSEETGYASTTEGKVFKTTDAGNSWESIASLHQGWQCTIIFPNENEGWYRVGYRLYHSTDAGETWSGPMLADQFIITLFFLDQSKGWIGGSYGFISTYDYIVNVPENEYVRDEVTVLPNPVSDKILIATPKGETIESFRLYDISGKLIMQNANLQEKPEYRIDVSKFKTGTYILQLECEEKMITKKFIKK